MFWQHHGIEKKDLLTPASILIGSILISLSICWASGVFGKGFASSGPTIPGEDKVTVNDRREAPRMGTGKVEIVEFSDFQCPFCQAFVTGAYKEIKAKYIDTGKVKLIFRHYPLSFHQNAEKSAEAAECASRQGKFWQYHDILFTKAEADGKGLEISNLKKYAADLGLNTNLFNSCLDNGEAVEAVKKDMDEGNRVGVTGTPTIFINGIKVLGAQPFANFEKIIEAELK